MKALHYSIVSACVAGILAGGAMKLGPDTLAERPIGPQILISSATNRVIDNDGWYAEAILTNYSGEIPEYVLGTDSTRPFIYDVAYEPVEYTYVEEETAKAPPPATPAVYTRPVVKETKPDKPQPVSYPSLDGDIVGEIRNGWPAPAQVVQIPAQSETLPS